MTPVLSHGVGSSSLGSEGDYGAGQMGALRDKFKRLKPERDTGTGNKRPFNYSPARGSGAVVCSCATPCHAMLYRAVPCHAVPCCATLQRGLTGEQCDAARRLSLVFLLPWSRGGVSSSHTHRRCSGASSPARRPPQRQALSSRQSLLPGKGPERCRSRVFGLRVTIVLLFCLAGKGAGGNRAARKAAGNPLYHN